jgi:hypothetical protein
MQEPIQKNIRSKKELGCGAVVEYLPSKPEVLSPNPSTAKRRKKFHYKLSAKGYLAAS